MKKLTLFVTGAVLGATAGRVIDVIRQDRAMARWRKAREAAKFPNAYTSVYRPFGRGTRA